MLVSNIQFEELSSTNLFLNSLFEQNIKINNYQDNYEYTVEDTYKHNYSYDDEDEYDYEYEDEAEDEYEHGYNNEDVYELVYGVAVCFACMYDV